MLDPTEFFIRPVDFVYLRQAQTVQTISQSCSRLLHLDAQESCFKGSKLQDSLVQVHEATSEPVYEAMQVLSSPDMLAHTALGR